MTSKNGDNSEPCFTPNTIGLIENSTAQESPITLWHASATARMSSHSESYKNDVESQWENLKINSSSSKDTWADGHQI